MNIFNELIGVMKDIRNTVNHPEIDLCWSKYNDLAELLKQIDFYIGSLEQADVSIMKDLSYFFAPTGSLQEISMSNGWGQKFIELSIVVDELIQK